MNREQLEAEIEEKHRKLARSAGWVVEKIVRTGRGGFPDRFYARAGRVVLMEFKRPRGRVTKQQLLRHKELRDAGVECHVVYSLAQAELVLRLDDVQRFASDQSTLDL
jgi:hypothetical protein